MDFLFNNARLASLTHTESMEQVMENKGNWLRVLHISDAAYAIMKRVNNDEYWLWSYTVKKEKNSISEDGRGGEGEEKIITKKG